MRLIIYIIFSFPFILFAQTVKPYRATQEVIERYPVDSVLLIKNAWLPNGEQIIKDGNGFRIYEIGQIRRYEYKNGDANGEVLFLDTTQTIVFTKGFCKNGKPDSTWTDFFTDKSIKAIYSYKNGSLNGDYVKYYQNGQVESKAHYRNNRLFGAYITYFTSGKIMLQGQYKDSVYCSPDSALSGNKIYQSSLSSAKAGQWIAYYENGKPKSVTHYSGTCTISNEIINSNRSQIIKKDCPEGEYLFYTENGILEKRMVYKNCETEHL